MACVHVTSKSGRVKVVAVPDTDLLVEGAELVDKPEGSYVKGKSRAIEITCPEGTDLIIGTSSGSVEIVGRVGAVKVSCASGSITVDHVEELDARTASGSVTIGTCDGDCRVVCASGNVKVGEAGNASIAAVSGSIRADEIGAGNMKSVSGAIDVGVRGGGDVGVRTVSGTVRVSVPGEHAPAVKLKSVSGHIRCDCDEGNEYQLSVGTVSGSIEVACR